MVTFELIENTIDFIRYRYYPENHRDREPGIIEFDIKSGSIVVDTPAADDFIRTVSAEELNSMRNRIDEMRKENDESEFTENELPIAQKNEQWYWFANHAIKAIEDAYNSGEILTEGIATWY